MSDPLLSPRASFKFYDYDPSLPLALVFVVLFGVSALLHVWQLVRSRTWYFIPFVIGCLFESVGYVGRVLSAQEAPDFTMNPYIIQSLLLLLGPAFFAASIYMVLGRLIVLLEAEEHSLIRPKWLTKIFVVGDVLSFLAQSGGGGMLAQAKDSDAVQMGENIIVGGLGIQIVFFGFFMVAILVFHIRLSRSRTRRSYSISAPWKLLLVVLYVTSILIMVRSVFRVMEYVEGSGGELKKKEIYIYVFDAALMGITSVVYNGFHPSRVIRDKANFRTIASAEVLVEGYPMQSGVHDRWSNVPLP